MLIVTHELKFAKDVSSRVFYVDQGGIYEDGTAEDIFQNPRRARTKAFVNHLSTKELLICSGEFDFVAMTEELRSFAAKKRLSLRQEEHLVECFRLLCDTPIIPGENEPRLHVFAQYDEKEDVLSLIFNRRGDRMNPLEDDALANALEPLIESSSFTYEDGRNRMVLRGIVR